MRYVKPGYYDKFVCIAGECPATSVPDGRL